MMNEQIDQLDINDQERSTKPQSSSSSLIPIGIFWDIENCPVPEGQSAAAIAQFIRKKFCNRYKEARFIVVCDIKKENEQVIQDLNDAQVTLIHAPATIKRAVQKLKSSIHQFAYIHGSSAAILVISNNVSFAVDLSDLKYRLKMHVILLYNDCPSQALIMCANEHYNLMELMEPLSKELGLLKGTDVENQFETNQQQLKKPESFIGIFWNLKNCPVPKDKSVAAVVQFMRNKFYDGHREAEFIVVCDVRKENKQVIQELNDAQVDVLHVPSTNDVDEKLKQSIRSFADVHGSSAAMILISSNDNFAADLSDLRDKDGLHVILLHNDNPSEAFIKCANEHYNFMELMEPLPARTPTKLLLE